MMMRCQYDFHPVTDRLMLKVSAHYQKVSTVHDRDRWNVEICQVSAECQEWTWELKKTSGCSEAQPSLAELFNEVAVFSNAELKLM